MKTYAADPTQQLIFFTIYMSLAYGIIYLTFTMYPLAFVKDRGWSPIKGSLPFLGILLGVTFACVLLAVHNICYVSPRFSKTQVHIPERRLPPMILGSVILPAGELCIVRTCTLLNLKQESFGFPGPPIPISSGSVKFSLVFSLAAVLSWSLCLV